MIFCAGIAFLGLCIPLPGTPFDELLSAGWPPAVSDVVGDEPFPVWSSDISVQSNGQGLTVHVSGRKTVVERMRFWINGERACAADRNDAQMQLRRAVIRHCTAAVSYDYGGSCRSPRGDEFYAYECSISWILTSDRLSPEEVKDNCDLFDSILVGLPVRTVAR